MAYNVSSAFREQCYSGSSLYKCRLIIGEETIPTSQIASITISSPIVDSENEIFYIGTFISQKLTIQFKNLDGINTKSGTGVELYISQYVNNNWEEVPIGKYIIDESPEDYYKSSKIECLDYAIKFATNLDYSPAFVDNKITIDNLLQWICDYYGVTLGSYPSTNGDIEIGTYDSTISGKRWISYIAELKGCNAKMDRLGQLTLVPLKSSPVVTIDAKKSKSWELGEKFEVSKVTYFDATRNYTFGDDTENTLILRQDNPFVVNEQVVRNIYENLRLASSMVEENTDFTLENTIEGEPIGSLSLKGDAQQDTAILPSEYQQVEYIQNSGTQYINTSYVPNYDNGFKVEVVYQPTNTTNRGCLFSNYNDTNHTSYEIRGNGKERAYLNEGQLDKDCDGTYTTGINTSSLEVTSTTTTQIVNGVTTTSSYSITGSANYPAYIFVDRMLRFGTFNNYIKLYSYKIYESGSLIRNFIPCYRKSDNVIGLYDTVNNVFHTNIGTGTFTKGNNVTLPTPDYPQEVKTVTGGQEINVTGKNLYPQDYLNGSGTQSNVVFTVNNDNSISANGTASSLIQRNLYGNVNAPAPCFLGNGTYIMTGGINGNQKVTLRISRGSSSSYVDVDNTPKTFTIDSQVTGFWIYLNIANGQSVNGTFKPMIRLSSITDDTYEPYKGFTQEINLGKNLLSGIEQGTLNSSGEPTSSTTAIRSINYDNVAPNTQYTISINGTATPINVAQYDSNKSFISFTYYNGTFTTSANTHYIKITRSGTVTDLFQVEKGNSATSYSAYKTPIELCKIGDYQDEILKSSGKNLLNLDRVLGTPSDTSVSNATKRTFNYNEYVSGISANNYYMPSNITSFNVTNNTITVNTSNGAYGLGFPVKVIANQNYKLSYVTSANSDKNTGVGYYSSDGTFLSFAVSTGTNNYLDISTPNNCDFIVLVFRPESGTSITYSNIQLELGTQSSAYEPYGTGWYIKKQIGKVVLDGTNILFDSKSGTTNNIMYSTTVISDIVKPSSGSIVSDILSNNFISKTPNTMYLNNTIGIGVNTNGTIACGFGLSSTLTTKELANTWLSTHNTIIYYQLTTPTYTTITDTELIEQLEHFEHNAKFYGGVTNINSTSPITFKLFTSDPFICYSLKTENYGDISLDSWDNITYTLGNKNYNTLINNTITYEMSIMSKVDTKIPTKQQEVTTNVVGGNMEARVRKIGSEVNSLSGQVTILGEEVDETSESLAEFTLTTDASIQSLTQTTSNLSSTEATHYQEMLSKMDDKASISDIETVTTQVNALQTDTYSKTEIQKILNGTDENGNVVQVVQTTAGTFDENGMTYNKTGAKTSSTINEAGLKVYEGSDMSKELLFAGFDTATQQALVRVANLYLTQFLGLDVWRVEIINDSTNGKGLGFFYIG